MRADIAITDCQNTVLFQWMGGDDIETIHSTLNNILSECRLSLSNNQGQTLREQLENALPSTSEIGSCLRSTPLVRHDIQRLYLLDLCRNIIVTRSSGDLPPAMSRPGVLTPYRDPAERYRARTRKFDLYKRIFASAPAKNFSKLELEIAIAIGDAPPDAYINMLDPETGNVMWKTPDADTETDNHISECMHPVPYETQGEIPTYLRTVIDALSLPAESENVRKEALQEAIEHAYFDYDENWRLVLPRYVAGHLMARHKRET